MTTRHKHADLIHALAEGAEIQYRFKKGLNRKRWINISPKSWLDDYEFRVKPKEPEWYENIPEHGVLCWVSDSNTIPNAINAVSLIVKHGLNGNREYLDIRGVMWMYATPLTNEEIEGFKR